MCVYVPELEWFNYVDLSRVAAEFIEKGVGYGGFTTDGVMARMDKHNAGTGSGYTGDLRYHGIWNVKAAIYQIPSPSTGKILESATFNKEDSSLRPRNRSRDRLPFITKTTYNGAEHDLFFRPILRHWAKNLVEKLRIHTHIALHQMIIFYKDDDTKELIETGIGALNRDDRALFESVFSLQRVPPGGFSALDRNCRTLVVETEDESKWAKEQTENMNTEDHHNLDDILNGHSSDSFLAGEASPPR